MVNMFNVQCVKGVWNACYFGIYILYYVISSTDLKFIFGNQFKFESLVYTYRINQFINTKLIIFSLRISIFKINSSIIVYRYIMMFLFFFYDISQSLDIQRDNR